MRSTRPDSSFYRKRAAAILGVAALFLVSCLYAPSVNRGPVICAMHGLFGLPCPGCGMTRAFCSLAQGHIPAALQYNALCIPVAFALIVVTIVAAYEIAIGRRTAWHRLLFSRRLAYGWATVVIVYHASRCIVWLFTGYLVSGYVKTSWTYHLLFHG